MKLREKSYFLGPYTTLALYRPYNGLAPYTARLTNMNISKYCVAHLIHNHKA